MALREELQAVDSEDMEGAVAATYQRTIRSAEGNQELATRLQDNYGAFEASLWKLMEEAKVNYSDRDAALMFYGAAVFAHALTEYAEVHADDEANGSNTVE